MPAEMSATEMPTLAGSSLVPVTDNTLVSPADFDSYCLTAPTNSRLPNSGERICGILEIKPAKFGLVNNVVNLDKQYGGQSEHYDGVDVTLNARFARSGMLGGGFAIGLERFIMQLLGLDNLRLAALFPRDLTRLTP